MNRSIPAPRVGVLFVVLLFGTGHAVRAQGEGAQGSTDSAKQEHREGNSALMKKKISASLQETFRFDPDAERPDLLDDAGVVLLEPMLVQETPLPRGLDGAVAAERIKLTAVFDLQKGGEFIKDALGRMTVEAKPHEELIKTDIGAAQPMARWTLLRIKW